MSKEKRTQTKRDSPYWFNCECPVCGAKFHAKKCRLKRTKYKPCCSLACSKKYRSTYTNGEKNHQFGLKGNKNASWKRDRKITRYGYIAVRALNHPFRDSDDFVFEHRLIAEKYLLDDTNSVIVNGKRYLNPNLVVHHIDFNKQNNEVSNLRIMEKSDHSRLHAIAIARSMKRNEKTGRFEKRGKDDMRESMQDMRQ